MWLAPFHVLAMERMNSREVAEHIYCPSQFLDFRLDVEHSLRLSLLCNFTPMMLCNLGCEPEYTLTP